MLSFSRFLLVLALATASAAFVGNTARAEEFQKAYRIGRIEPTGALTMHGPGMNTLTQIDRQNPTMDSGWVDHRWINHSVTTPRDVGETPTAQAARHMPAVVALQREFPAVATTLSAPSGHGHSVLTPPEDDAATASIGQNDSVMHSSWKDANNVTHSVSTPRQTGETVTAQAVRHAAAVNALALAFKPVSPAT